MKNRLYSLALTLLMALGVGLVAATPAHAGPKPWGPSSSYSPPWLEREYVCVERFRLFWFQDVTWECYVLDAP